MSRFLLKPSSELATKPTIDPLLLGAGLVLAGLGLVMVLSASGVMAERMVSDKYYFFKKQCIFALIGLVVMVVMAKVPRSILHGPVYPVLFGVLIMCAMTLIPQLSVKAGGARRWLAVGPISIQPLEFAKAALVFYLAYFFSRKQDLVRSFTIGFLPPIFITLVFCFILLLQPDMGGAVFLGMLFFFMSLVGGTRIFYLLGSSMIGVAAMGLLIMSSEYRVKRFLAFLDPFKHSADIGYQLVQSFLAFGSGGIGGVGFGAGKQKLFYLPEAHNDFIMAVVGEELGFVGVSLVFICVGILLWRAFSVALAQDDLRDRFTAYGMTMILGLGFLLNMAVVLGCIPPKGVAMPFLSYGGSNMVACFLCLGILLNLSRKRPT
ncbi:putative lipid II flippase FtsW [Desulfovibrio inopinatus]|uniref:putative lipid II flippase FtsW n=1 Tax=Desulfovibrio inopinatus TaxID=102109 RepID=UPI00040712CC|nr:putative lipid II flippase FtsW [Desulfovibrio inopinatus]